MNRKTNNRGSNGLYATIQTLIIRHLLYAYYIFYIYIYYFLIAIPIFLQIKGCCVYDICMELSIFKCKRWILFIKEKNDKADLHQVVEF